MRTQELLDAVYAEPARDDLRSVLADHLIEQGDPRGELIALQIVRARTGAAPTRREQALLKEHGAAWAGRLHSFFAKSDRAFRRGFIARGRADGQWKMNFSAAEHAASRVTGLVEWTTVEEFALPRYLAHVGPRVLEMLTHPILQSLALLHNVPSELAQKIERSETPPPLVELGLTDHHDRIAGLGERGLRGVRKIVLGPVSGASDLDSLARSALWPQLEALTLSGYHQEPLDRLPEHLDGILERAPSSLRTISFMGNTQFPWSPEGWHVEISRDERGRFSRLAAAFGACSYGYSIVGDKLAAALETLPPDSITAIDIRKTRAYKPTAEQTARLERARARFA